MAPIAAAVSRHGKPVDAVFDLLGHQENDLTAALGFALSRSPLLLAELLAMLEMPKPAEVRLRMEAFGDVGRTDLEIESHESLIIVEAKRGWNLPSVTQLEQYVSRVLAHGGGRLVTLSDCSFAYAATQLPASLEGVLISHLPWAEVKRGLGAAKRSARGTERHWLRELETYLQKAVRVRDPSDSWAYCVVLSRDRPGGGGARTFRDFVVQDGFYFHPYGWGSGGWPKRPPNFLAFRWNNQVQQVRRVASHEVVPNLQDRWSDIPPTSDTTRPHIVYELGPPIPMKAPIPSGPPGTNYRAARPWVLVDQLLTSPTLKEAIASSRQLQLGASSSDQAE